MSEPATAPPAATDLPAEVSAPAEAAARALAVGRPCPACGSPLEGNGVLGNSLGVLLSEGLLFVRRTIRCGRCGLEAEPAPPHARSVAVAVVIAVLADVAVMFGTRLEGDRLTAVQILLACLIPPIFLWRARAMALRSTQSVQQARARWKAKQEESGLVIDGAQLLAVTAPGKDCAVCGKAPLEGLLPEAPLWTRPPIRCPRCRLDLPATFTQTGMAVGFALAAVLIVAGGLLVNAAREAQGNDFLLRAFVGLGIALGGLYVGVMIQGSGDETAAKELERAKRRLERRKRGLKVQEDDDEPALWFQENLEAVVVAVILALIIRHYVMEAFVIPTGSMAPTLLGDHFDAKCRNCGNPFAVAKVEGDMNPRGEEVDARCPLCGADASSEPSNRFTFMWPDVRGGNKILVNKFLYKIRPPQRYEVIVFKYPREPTRKNFIKRLIGLPGEQILIDGRGDVSVKAPGAAGFEIARKGPLVQEELWMPVFDARYPDPRGVPWLDLGAKEGDAATKRLEIAQGAGGADLVVKPGTGDAWVGYNREIKDHYGYNKGYQSTKPVGDLRVQATVTPAADAKVVRLATLENEKSEAERFLVVELPVGDGNEVRLLSGGQVIGKAATSPLAPGRPTAISLAFADQRATVTVDGKELIVTGDPATPTHVDGATVRLGCGPGGARFANVRIDRDVVYVSSGTREFDPSRGAVEIPKGCYFAMGDNSPNSQDGRSWGFVHEPHLIGRAFLVFWPLFQTKLIR